jgi:glycosyltransferase involved in cell wall biosynthesis
LISRRISVALATYNGERYLAEQLASLARQSCRPFELVVVDDGSADGTVDIVRNFSETAPFPVRVFCNERRLGYAKNFLRAAELCSGDIISFCDQDDVWSHDKLERVVREFDDEEVLLVYHNAHLMDATGRLMGYVFKPTESSATLSHQDVEPWRIVPGFAQAIRRSLLRYSYLHKESLDIFNMDERMPHDQWFLFLSSALGKSTFVSRNLAGYRLHSGNASGWLPAKPIAFALHNIAHASYYVRAYHEGLRNRIGLLEKLKASLPAERGKDIDAVLDYHAHISKHVARRVLLYSEKSFRMRLRLLMKLVRGRTYRDERIRFNRGSMLLDTIVGVPLGGTRR